ncbi:hypothetical protein IscW_ISCW005946 [Ixodes scapularis]|uniref:Secreted protein n=1 Tax=Ixodes scapularis TaxID=6945 RepID=B7PPG8_IXOSC|nr:hypothetical protein IscW_ISCW005946 [Ixodes scapularis]|eukprot:XP_002435660.1 hypothetical protein IscW_ISCW005946 [Ixodes scapularis]
MIKILCKLLLGILRYACILRQERSQVKNIVKVYYTSFDHTLEHFQRLRNKFKKSKVMVHSALERIAGNKT